MDDDARELNGDERISKLVEAVDQENVLHTLYWPEQLSDKSKVNEAGEYGAFGIVRARWYEGGELWGTSGGTGRESTD